MADKIRRDERVSIIERTNLRYLSELPQKVDLVTLDLSFISILTVSCYCCFFVVLESVFTFEFLLFYDLSYWSNLIHGEIVFSCHFVQVMPAVVNLMKEESTLITLIKPQFEARRSQVSSFLLSRFTPFRTIKKDMHEKI